MPTELVMPRLSDTMDTGTIAKWLKHEGDEVKKGDVIAEIETDKANMELESYASGVLAQISVQEGQSVSVGEPIGVIAGSQEEAQQLKGASPQGETKEAATPAPAQSQTQPSQGPPAQPQVATEPQAETREPQAERTEPNTRVKASPLARRMAQEHEIDLANVSGTGPGGRITKDDIQSYLQQAAPTDDGRRATAPPAEEPRQAPQPAQRQPTAQPQPIGGTGREGQPVEMTRMQQTIARRMRESRFSAPDFVLTAEFDMTEARSLLKSVSQVEGAPKVGPNDLLVKASANALRQHPDVNTGWEDDTMVRYGRVNVGFAVALPDGLVVPVVQDADKKTLGQIALETKELIEKARTGKLAPNEYEGGTFTISNLGMYGIDQFTPIINPPEACIMGVGTIVPKPVVLDGEVVVRDRLRVTLSCDHRVVYGAQGAEFLQTLRRLLEHPMLTLL